MKRISELDRRTRRAAIKVRVLSTLSWPEGTVQELLESFEQGQPRLPKVRTPKTRLGGRIAALEAVIDEAPEDEPLGRFVADTARSYRDAARMLEAAGTPKFTELSCKIYGHPRDTLPGAKITHLEAAQRLLDNTSALAEAGVVREDDVCVTPDAVSERLRRDFEAFFGEASPVVEIDPSLASKAAAGSTRVRIRGETCFSELDIDQLREHEGFVHSATKLNGRGQPTLSCLGLSSPRTTEMQEGLATVAELITHSMDIGRLRRIALRTVAIDMALEGADYLEVFRYFLEAGQSAPESALSAMRVFRGGDVKGQVAFTKDVVYLAGLIEVHTFLRKAIEESRPHLVARLFAGRMTLGDLGSLAPAFEEGLVKPARFVPSWATDMPRLGAYLAFNALVDLVDLSRFELPESLRPPPPAADSG